MRKLHRHWRVGGRIEIPKNSETFPSDSSTQNNKYLTMNYATVKNLHIINVNHHMTFLIHNISLPFTESCHLIIETILCQRLTVTGSRFQIFTKQIVLAIIWICDYLILEISSSCISHYVKNENIANLAQILPNMLFFAQICRKCASEI